MGFRKFVLFFFPSPLFSYSLVNGKMSNAIRRGEDDEREREIGEEEKKTDGVVVWSSHGSLTS